MTIKTFLSGVDGEKSSKRIGFFITLGVAILCSVVAIFMAIKDNKYNEAISIIDSMWTACYIFCGLVATEIIGKFAPKDKKE
jgi:hypothetical protein